MLTMKQIFKAARLMHQVGELRPGFLHKDSANLEGFVHPRPISRKKKQTNTGGKIAVVRRTDDDSGESYFSMSD